MFACLGIATAAPSAPVVLLLVSYPTRASGQTIRLTAVLYLLLSVPMSVASAAASGNRHASPALSLGCNAMHASWLGMKTDRIRMDITDIVFVFIFMSGFGFEYG
jgi:hypothetical protein